MVGPCQEEHPVAIGKEVAEGKVEQHQVRKGRQQRTEGKGVARKLEVLRQH